MKFSNSLLAALSTTLIVACGGGSSDGAGDTPPVANPTPNPSGEILTGRFIDSAVSGLEYATATQSGETGTDGSFNYMQGESVTFSIGDITLPATAGADIITPLSVFSTTDITDLRVMNLARLLQTLDTDGIPENGISLSDTASASATGLNLDFAADNFDASVVNLVANGGSINTSLVGGMEALEHLQESLFVEGVEERPTAADVIAEMDAAATGGSTTHPAVGTSSEFTTRAHDVSGTLTVIDDRTLEVSNFVFDGGGVNVFFYYGTDGDYRNGGQIGPQLRGTVFNGETITLTLPDGLTLDDFNGLSVWCVPFFADFGDARF